VKRREAVEKHNDRQDEDDHRHDRDDRATALGVRLDDTHRWIVASTEGRDNRLERARVAF